MVIADRSLSAQIFERPTNAGKVLRKTDCPTFRRLDGVIESVIDERITNERRLRGSCGLLNLQWGGSEWRDFVDLVSVAQPDIAIFRSRKTEPQTGCGRIALIVGLLVVGHDLVQVKSSIQGTI